MTTRPFLATAVALATYLPAPAAAQSSEHGHVASPGAPPDSAAVADFLARAREGTAPFRDRSAAIRAGFKRLGPDFPAMGEHWIHLGRVFETTVDPARPAMLSYATMGGQPTLIGVVYVQALLSGQEPADAPAGREAWHEHVRTVDEEALVLEHVARSRPGSAPARLAVLHAWIWLENPRGPFQADNWALPMARLGVKSGDGKRIAAAKALSLLTGGDAHLIRVLNGVGRPDSAEQVAMLAVVERRREEVRALVTGRSGDELTPDELTRLEESWQSMWTDLLAVVSPATASRLETLSAR
jgi:hypothetical protein